MNSRASTWLYNSLQSEGKFITCLTLIGSARCGHVGGAPSLSISRNV